MTAATTPVSLSAQIAAWMAEHPGRYRPNEVAEALWDLTPVSRRPAMGLQKWRQKVTNEMARMGRGGKLERTRVSDKAMGPGVLYWLPGSVPGSKS